MGLPQGWGTVEDLRLVEVGKSFGVYVYGSGTVDQLLAAQAFGIEIESRLNIVGGNTGWTLQQLEQAEKPDAVPQMPTMSVNNISDKSASVNWTPYQYDKPTVTSFHFVLKNIDSDQTITETNFMSGQRNSYESNLDSGTNYKGYLIAVNAIGNSIENSIGFKTTGIKVEPPVVIPPVITPPIVTPPIVIPPVIEKTWCIDVYQINEFGGVYPIHKEDVKRLELLQWEKNTLVKECGDPIPSDDEVRDFYNFVDTSINENMVSQSVGYFKLENGKVQGDIIYIAESAFNPYYYNKPVTSVVQIKNRAGNIIKLKTNNLNFTETQRDETININEGVGDIDAVKIEYYVWKGINEPVSFSIPQKPNEIVAEEVGLDPCPIGQHRDFNNNCVDDDIKEGTTSLLGKVLGVTALLGTLALLGSKGR
jgi:hypothetical protein